MIYRLINILNGTFRADFYLDTHLTVVFLVLKKEAYHKQCFEFNELFY